MLSDLTLTAKEVENEPCDDDTLAYLYPATKEKASITLCPSFFKKKAFTKVKGAPNPDNDPTRYVRCEELQANGHVSYLMETMGATLLHEYTHFDKLTRAVLNKPILDQKIDQNTVAYGAFFVYNNLNKNLLARVNADSYTYYALELFWTEVCHTNFLARMEGIDDVGPDCGGSVCTRDRSSLLSGSSEDGSSLSTPPPSYGSSLSPAPPSEELGSVPP
ncbi:MAG: hypothetical protein Q9221_006324 [Calogaya cf. arnoldii]